MDEIKVYFLNEWLKLRRYTFFWRYVIFISFISICIPLLFIYSIHVSVGGTGTPDDTAIRYWKATYHVYFQSFYSVVFFLMSLLPVVVTKAEHDNKTLPNMQIFPIHIFIQFFTWFFIIYTVYLMAVCCMFGFNYLILNILSNPEFNLISTESYRIFAYQKLFVLYLDLPLSYFLIIFIISLTIKSYTSSGLIVFGMHISSFFVPGFLPNSFLSRSLGIQFTLIDFPQKAIFSSSDIEIIRIYNLAFFILLSGCFYLIIKRKSELIFNA
jgi:hypothetical protein